MTPRTAAAVEAARAVQARMAARARDKARRREAAAKKKAEEKARAAERKAAKKTGRKVVEVPQDPYPGASFELIEGSAGQKFERIVLRGSCLMDHLCNGGWHFFALRYYVAFGSSLLAGWT
jgi:hypothetical protein